LGWPPPPTGVTPSVSAEDGEADNGSGVPEGSGWSDEDGAADNGSSGLVDGSGLTDGSGKNVVPADEGNVSDAGRDWVADSLAEAEGALHCVTRVGSTRTDGAEAIEDDAPAGQFNALGGKGGAVADDAPAGSDDALGCKDGSRMGQDVGFPGWIPGGKDDPAGLTDVSCGNAVDKENDPVGALDKKVVPCGWMIPPGEDDGPAGTNDVSCGVPVGDGSAIKVSLPRKPAGKVGSDNT